MTTNLNDSLPNKEEYQGYLFRLKAYKQDLEALKKTKLELSSTYLYQLFSVYDPCFRFFLFTQLKSLYTDVELDLIPFSWEPDDICARNHQDMLNFKKPENPLPDEDEAIYLFIWTYLFDFETDFELPFFLSERIGYSLNRIEEEVNYLELIQINSKTNPELSPFPLFSLIRINYNSELVFLLQVFAIRERFRDMYLNCKGFETFKYELVEYIIRLDVCCWRIFKSLEEFGEKYSETAKFFEKENRLFK